MSENGRPWRLALAGAGTVVTAYLTLQHFVQQVPLVCVQGGRINCHAVLTSPYAVWAGIPVTAWGLGWFVVMLGLARASGASWARWRLAWAGLGTVVVLYLVYVEFVVLATICLWCSFLHALILTLLALELWQWWQRLAVT